MIRYALACDLGHAFEGWFSASVDYDEQAARGLLSCPVCDSQAVRKQIMAPAVAGASKRDENGGPAAHRAAQHATMVEMMTQVRRHVESTFDYVGPKFAAEARAIHDGKAEERGIYGEATKAEVTALVADGVSVAPLPPEAPKKKQLN